MSKHDDDDAAFVAAMTALKAKQLEEKKPWEEWTCPDTGDRWVTGKGGGRIIFHAAGEIDIQWMESAAIASSHASGNRTTRITEPGDKGMPPQFTELFDLVSTVRRVGRQGGHFPADHKHRGVLKKLEIFRALAWRMLRAVALGNVPEIRAVADHLEKCEGLHTGKLEVPLDLWGRIADSIRDAAQKAKGVPERSKVYAEYTDRRLNNPAKTSLNDDLVRMGFGWLPAPGGKPKKANPVT
jgi:hypothetical protein